MKTDVNAQKKKAAMSFPSIDFESCAMVQQVQSAALLCHCGVSLDERSGWPSPRTYIAISSVPLHVARVSVWLLHN
jgi:hypothetical protein